MIGDDPKGTKKIDDAPTLGLSGTDNSLAYRVHEIERHIHSHERWLETAAVASGETHVADVIGTGGGSFQLDAGNDDWGSWVQILGSSDTPVITNSEYYDLHRIEIDTEERAGTYFLQFAFGASGAAALSAGTYTETIYTGPAGAQSGGPVVIQSRRIASGTKAWARTMFPGQDTATIDLYIGIHEYEG
jgi:hypothetical protein